MNKDYLHKYLVLKRQARVITVFSTNTVRKYCRGLKLISPTATAAMGRLISATLMMGSTLKGNERIMVTVDGGGKIGPIRAESDAFGNVRAFASNPEATAPLNEYGNLNVSELVGNDGYLQVRKQLNMKEPFIGTCELVSGEIGEDISYYYGTSEQTPTIVALGVLLNKDGTCKQAGGFLIQLLPNASQEAYDFLDKILHEVKSVSKLITEAKSSDNLVYKLFDEAELLFEYPCHYKCTCSITKTKALLTQLSKDELNEDIAKGEGLDVTCNFCGKVYHIDTNGLKKVLEMKEKRLFNIR